MRPLEFVIILVFVDLAALSILYSLIRPKTPQAADNTTFKATFKGFRGTLVATAGGAIASFLTIFAALIAAFIILDRLA
jgi:predicted lipid-binding transport protein (Tim44 family)